MKPKMQSAHPRRLALIALTLTALPHALQAASVTWANSGTDLNAGASWSGGIAPGAADVATFSGAPSTAPILSAPAAVLGLAFADAAAAGYSVSGSTLTVGTAGIDASALTGGTNTISSNLALATGAQTWNVGAGATLSLATGAFSRNNGSSLNLPGAGTVSSSMSGLANTNGIIGTWATTGTGAAARYATLNAGNLVGYTGATVMSTAASAWGGIPSGGTGNVNYEITISGLPGETGLNRNVNSIRYTGSGMTQRGNNTGLLLNTNGILNAGTGAFVIGLTVNQFGIAPSTTTTNNQMVLSAANADLTINADIRNNGTNATSVITTGPGTVTLAANNPFTGDLFVNSGTLVASRGNNVNNAANSSLGNPQVARNVVVNPGATLRMTGGDVLGSATTTPLCTVVINRGAAVTNGGNNFNSFGPLVMNGGQLTTSGGAVANYQSYNLMGSVTIGGMSPSTISIDGAGNGFDGVHLNTNTLFTVADATADSAADLIVSAPLLDRNGSLGGAGGFTKGGAGTMTLAGTHPFTGPTTISGGTLRLGDGVTDGSISASSGITNNASLVFDIGGSHTYANPIAGSGSLTLTGGGFLALPGANNLAGGVSIEDGTLETKGSFGAVSIADNPANLLAHTSGGAISASSLSFAGDAALDLLLTGLPAAPAPIAVTGALTTTPASGQVAIEIHATALDNGFHNLVGFGSFGGNPTDFTANVLSGLNSRQSAIPAINGSNLAIQVDGDSPKWTGLDSGSWKTGSTGTFANWKLVNAGTATDFAAEDYVLFDDTASGATTVTIDNGDVSPRTVTFDNSSLNYTLTSVADGVFTGAMSKSGTGSLTIESDNLFDGGFTFTGGTLNINSATAIGTGPLAIEPGTAKVLDNTSGSPVVNLYANTQTWLDDITFTGSDDLDLGTGAVTVGGDGSERVVTVSGATFAVGEVKAPFHGFVKDGSGTLVLSSTGAGADASVLGGALDVAAGLLQFNRTGADVAGSGDLTATGISGSGTITNGAAVERWLFINTTGADVFSGTLANGGAGGLGFNKQGTGSVVLSGTLSHTGQTSVEGGSLVIPVANTGSGTNAVVSAGTLVMANPQALGASSTIRLAGNNVATLDIATDGGDNLYGFVFATGVNSTLVSNRATTGEGINHTLTTIGANGIGGGTLTVTSGANVTSGTGRITFNEFGLSAGAADQVTVLNPTTASVTVGNVSKVANTAAQALGLGGTSTDNHVTGLIADGSAAVSVRKTGDGTWTISNANNTYTGGTTIGAANGAGVLRVTASGALGTGTIVFDGSGGNPGPTSRLELSDNITLVNPIALHQRNNDTPQILNTGGNNTLGGNINLTTGGSRGNVESNGGLLTIAGTVSTITTVTRNLHLGGIGDGEVTGAIVDNNLDAAGKVAVHKNGAGTWTLSGANTNTGETTVNAGTLSIANPVLADSAAVRIAADAVLNLSHDDTDTVDRLFIDGVEQYTGTWGSLTSSATHKTARITGTGILQVTNGVTPPSGYGTWASTNAPGQTMDQDHDDDGVANGVEYFMGLSGSSFTTNPAPSGGTVTWPMGVTYSGVYGTDYEVQSSTDLANWTQVVEGTGDDTVTVTAGTSVAYDMPTGGKTFVRLVVRN